MFVRTLVNPIKLFNDVYTVKLKVAYNPYELSIDLIGLSSLVCVVGIHVEQFWTGYRCLDGL